MGSILKKSGFLILFLLCAGQLFAQWPRFFWEQIEASDSTGRFAITNNSLDGEWNTDLRLLTGNFIRVDNDTLSTRAYARSVGGGGGSDGNGIFDATNDGGTVPTGMNFTLTDSLQIDYGGNVFSLTNDLFYVTDGGGAGFIEFDLTGDASNSLDIALPSGERFIMDPDNLYWESRYGNKLELHTSSIDQNFQLTINPDNGTGDAVIIDSRVTATGLEYNADYSAGFTARSLVDREFVTDYFGGTLPGAFTEGSVIFAGASGGLTEDNTNLFWDDTNDFLGIGTTTQLSATNEALNVVAASNYPQGGATIIGQRSSSATGLTGGVQSGGGWYNPDLTPDNYSSLQFFGRDSSGTIYTFGHIANTFVDHTTGSIDSKYSFLLRDNNTMRNALTLNSDRTAEFYKTVSIGSDIEIDPDDPEIYIAGDGTTTISSTPDIALANRTHGLSVYSSASDYEGAALILHSGSGGSIAYTHNGGSTFRFIVDNDGDAEFNGTGSLKIPTGTTAQRITGETGMIRANTDSTKIEWYTGSTWVGMASSADIGAGTGGIYGGSGSLSGNTTVTMGSDDLYFEGDKLYFSYEHLSGLGSALWQTPLGATDDAQWGAAFETEGSTAYFDINNAVIQATMQATWDEVLFETDTARILIDTLFVITDKRTNFRGVEYAADYSSGYTSRSLVDKAYVDDNTFSGTVGEDEIAYGSAADTLTSSDVLTIDPTGAFKGINIADHTSQGTRLDMFSNNDGVANIVNSSRGHDDDADNADFYYDQLDVDNNMFAIWTTIPVKDSANMLGGVSEVEIIKPFVISADENHTTGTFGTRIDMYVREKNNTSTDTKVFTADSDGDITFPSNDVHVTDGQVVLDNVADASLPTGISGGSVFNTTANKPTWYDGTDWQQPDWVADRDYGVTTGSTDGSGDLTVNHDLNTATIFVTALPVGTTFYNLSVHTKTSSTFKIRFFDAAGSAVTSTSVTVDWIARK